MSLRSDLEALHDSLSHGWCQYGYDGGQSAPYGDGRGCLSQQIAHTNNLSQQMVYNPWAPTYDDMLVALGFESAVELYRWNDHRERTWQQVLDRVKDAIANAPIGKD